ncbi:hypothetical protein ES332_A13G172600v1 [Gossypium tomentosum]|uniref:Uncharacterized protein n=1 Tax=Gossypium tomentosum TaxID=34277 RepID=A0A5D2MLH3_GOSTO|nr:hypothetical protein ES332_A13G172600v1 [Gossypium tomentosum]TYH92295.1 hypothetical protein ES332_A13G172600v1 [Gossypium tomentosum]
MALKNQKDHWAFLEEIEAPMWVDLISETNFSSQDIDDKWFQTSHLFHQCSSSQLKSAFSCSGEEGVTLELDLVGAYSPTLPQTVSRSRGKDFRSKKWKGNCCDISWNKIESMKVLKGKSLVYGEGIKPKLNFINSKGTSRSKTNLVSEITENAKGKNVKPVSNRGGPERSLSPVVDKSGETNGRSTVTSESIQQQQQQKFFEVSSRGFGQTSELLTSVRSSLRKSCITRPASRVEINADRSHRMESRDSRSSSGKSSVGSSSYSGYEAKRSTVSWIKRKEKTPDSRNVARPTEAAKTKVEPSNMCKKSNVRGKEGERNSRTGGLVTVTKITWEEAVKSKANSQTHRSTLSLLHKVNEQKPLADARKASEKVGVGNKVRDTGKENNAGEIPLSQKCNGKGKAAEGIVARKKGATQSTSAMGGKTGMVVPKGRVVNQREGKNPTNSIPKVHFR